MTIQEASKIVFSDPHGCKTRVYATIATGIYKGQKQRLIAGNLMQNDYTDIYQIEVSQAIKNMVSKSK